MLNTLLMSSRPSAREALKQQIKQARTPAELVLAHAALATWLAKHPDDAGMRQAGHVLMNMAATVPTPGTARESRKGTLADFFASSPLRDVPELDLERLRETPRDIEL